MKFMESKEVYRIVDNSGKVIETISIRCHGNGSYRVFLGNKAVNSIFSSEEEARDYCKLCAEGNPDVLVHRAKAVELTFSHI